MNESLQRYFSDPGPVVSINARVFPYLDEMAITFDGVQFDAELPPLPKLAGETRSACEAAIVTVSGHNVNVLGAPVNLRLHAHDVVFHSGPDEKSEALLLLHNVRTGHALISASQLDLDNAIRRIAQREAQKHGISVEETRVSFRARGPRSLAADMRLRARKFLLRANIDLTAQIDVETDFSLKVSNLKCRGEGMLGSIAGDLLTPLLQKLDGRKFSIMPLLSGEIRLHDIRIAVADTLEITADFGAAAA
jgi:head-tail adaptor